MPVPLTRLQVVTQFYPPDYAPTGQLIAELTQRLGSPSTKINVFTSQPAYAYDPTRTAPNAPAREQVGAVQVRRSRGCRAWSQRVRGKTLGGAVFFIRSVLHLLRRHHQADVLLVTTAPPFLPMLGYLMHRLFRLPYVCLLYDLYPDIAIRFGILSPDHWLSRLWARLNRHTWRHAQAVIVLSPSMKAQVLQQEPSLADRVVIIHNWADPREIRPIAKHHNEFAIQHNLVEPFTVLYSGNMGRCHDLETVIAAATHLRDEPVKFLLIGDGPQRRRLKALVQTHQLTNVIFLPYQDRAILPLSLTACDLSLVSIDERMEGLIAPSKFYSALAAGRPIAAICASDSYLCGLIDAANCGRTFANRDPQGLAQFIRHLYQTPQYAESMGRAGRRYCETHFTPEVITEEYRRVLFPYVPPLLVAVDPDQPAARSAGTWQPLGDGVGTDPPCPQSPSLKLLWSRWAG